MRYLFNCEKCGEFEVSMSYKDLPLKNCPNCNKPDPERVYTSFRTGQIDGFCGKSYMWNSSDKG